MTARILGGGMMRRKQGRASCQVPLSSSLALLLKAPWLGGKGRSDFSNEAHFRTYLV